MMTSKIGNPLIIMLEFHISAMAYHKEFLQLINNVRHTSTSLREKTTLTFIECIMKSVLKLC